MTLKDKLLSLFGRPKPKKQEYEIPESWKKRVPQTKSAEKTPVKTVKKPVKKSAVKRSFTFPKIKPVSFVNRKVMTIKRFAAVLMFVSSFIMGIDALGTYKYGLLSILYFFNAFLLLDYLMITRRKKEL